MLPFLRKSLSFEFRKRLHYLAVPWAIAICFHAPAGHVAKIIGLALAIYAAGNPQPCACDFQSDFI
jgi:hypothetical protein